MRAIDAVRSVRGHARQPFHRDGYALVLNALLTAWIGLLFWIVAARSYEVDDVGANAVLISSMMFLAGVANLNLANILVRFLVDAGSSARTVVLLCYGVAMLAATAAALVFVVGVGRWAPAFDFLSESTKLKAWFVLSTLAWCVFLLQDGAVTGLGRAVWVPVQHAAFSCLKLVLLVSAVAIMPGYGIFACWTVAATATILGVNALLLVRLLRPAGEPPAGLPPSLFRPGFGRRFAADYLSSIGWLASTTLLPLVVTITADVTAGAYFSITWAVAFPLYAVAAGVATALVVHGAADPAAIGRLARRAALQAGWLVVVGIGALVAFGPGILRLFGEEYAGEGAQLLRLLAVAALPNLVIVLAVSVARVQQRPHIAVLALWLQAAVALGLAVPLLRAHDITGVGIAWLVSQTAVAALLAVAFAVRGATGRAVVADPRAWLADGVSGAWIRGARGTRLAEAILADVVRRQPELLPGGPEGLNRVRTDSKVVVVLAGGPPAPRLVVKIAWTEAAALRLDSQRRTLAALREIPDLREWLAVVPDVVAQGTIAGRSFLVETALPGIDGRTLMARGCRERTLAAVVEGIAPLYRSTASALATGECLRACLLDTPLERVARARAAVAPAAIDRLRRELGDALLGGRVGAGWVHGDLWLGNTLLREDASALTGLVDWEASRQLGIPPLDVAQLVLSTRSLCEGRDLGLVVGRLLAGHDRLSAFERELIASVTHPDDELGLRAVLLLTWLQLVAWRLLQTTLYPQRLWVRHNIDPVLGALGR